MSRVAKKGNQIVFDFNNMMSDYIGKEEGIRESDISAVSATVKNAYNSVIEQGGAGWQGWLDLPYNQDEIVKDIIATAKDVRKKFRAFVCTMEGQAAAILYQHDKK